jgi:acetylglutamate kinase
MPFAANPYDALKGMSKYLRQFRGKTFVVKLGGDVLDDAESRKLLCEQLGVLWTLSIRLVLVHGGGSRIDQLCADLNIATHKVNGRRITSPEVLDVSKMVLAGSVHTDLLAQLSKAGVPAVGLSGLDADMIKSHKRPPILIGEEGGKPKLLDYGLVGDVQSVDPKLLKLLLDQDYVPVIAPLTIGPDGQVLNTNADTIASRVAAALGAEKLFFVLRVPGLLRDADQPSSLISFATAQKLEEMEAAGKITGGMLPKSSAIKWALAQGVHSVHLVSGVMPDALLVEIFTNEGAGSMIMQADPHG